MDLLELALNPRKANQRMSPFTKELPAGQARKLEYYFGDRASDDIAERVLYSRDAAAPPATLNMLLKRDAWAVVRPRVRGELLELIEYANHNGVPIVPRGAGTSGYGGGVPTEGGVVVDMRGLNKILEIDEAAQWVRCEANATFAQVEQALNAKGLTLRQYPTSFHAATLAGWVCQGGGGVGSHKYGPFENDVIGVQLLAPDGQLHQLQGNELSLVNGTFGTAGFLVEVKLKVRPMTQLVHFLASFDDTKAATQAAKRAALETKAYNVALLTPEYTELFNQAAGSRILPQKACILVTLESGENAQAIEVVKGIVLTGGGTMAKEADAQRAWDNRFNHLNMKRLGPSVVVAESVIHADGLNAAMDAVAGANRSGRWCSWAIAISPSEFDVIYYGLDDERRATYPLSMGNALAVIDAVKAVGGRSYGTGVLASNESKLVLGADRLKALKQWRKKTDKREVFNPGPVLGARTRMMPLPVKDFPLQLKLAAPMLKAQRGLFEYRGGDKADPQWAAQQRALGRVHAGNLGSLATEVTTCIFCGLCNGVAPEAMATPWESAMPRGRVQLAKAVIEGRATLSARVHRNVAWTALEHAPDAVCPTAIPIQRVTDLLLAACVAQFGPLPEQAGIVESFKENGNGLGKPKDARNKWVNIGFDPVAPNVYLPDDVAAYLAPEVAASTAAVLANAGYAVGHLGNQDAGSAAVLFETGNREAADEVLTPLLKALDKRGATTIVTPDANAARAIAVDWPLVAKENDLSAPKVVHTATLFADLIRMNKLEFETKLEKKVVIHAPEGLTTEQRGAVAEVAKATGADIVDCPHHECGHGRALKEFDPALATQMAEGCLKAAVNAGADTIVTMSPGCYTTLKDANKKAKAGLEILDLNVVVAQNMKAREGGAAPAPVAVEEEAAAPVEPEIGPDQYRVEFVKEGVVLAIGKNQTILEAGEEAGMELPSSCRAGSCDTCSAKYEGTPPDQSAGEALSPDDQKTYVLTCIARPKGPVKIWSDERP